MLKGHGFFLFILKTLGNELWPSLTIVGILALFMKNRGSNMIHSSKTYFMKKKITLFAVLGISSAILFTACNNKHSNTATIPASDTAGFAAYKAMQAQKEAQELAAMQRAATRQAASRSSNSGTYSSSTTNSAKVESQKKGWSKSAKYGVGGAVGGAVLGAVINKKDPVRGAVVGGVIGGGGGYIYGRSQDKKDGRVQ